MKIHFVRSVNMKNKGNSSIICMINNSHLSGIKKHFLYCLSIISRYFQQPNDFRNTRKNIGVESLPCRSNSGSYIRKLVSLQSYVSLKQACPLKIYSYYEMSFRTSEDIFES